MHHLTKSAVLALGLFGTVATGALAQTTPAPAVPAATPAPAAATPAAAATVPCTANSDPYVNYSCLDTYLGDNPFVRFFRYYELEMGHASAPSDPNAPASRVDGWPRTPQTTPPMPFTEWPYGGSTAVGVTRTGSVDSPLMTAIANTGLGRWMNDMGFQVYGWIDPGFNFSSNTVRKPGGNAPVAYAYIPNTAQLDQFVVYLDRFPDTVQQDHIDWGLRLSAIYGENYRYTTSYGIASYQLLKYNAVNGYDFPMLYGEIYIPYVAQGLMIRAGRYISVPDIEAQLAPNNYMYTHSLTYSFDNYTNEGVIGTVFLTKNISVQAGVEIGTEAAFTNTWNTVLNPNPNTMALPNPLYPGNRFSKDPGAVPSFTLCARITWNDGWDDLNPCANGINGGQWGYNNLQWYGVTYYHKFDDHWHLAAEFYDEHENGVPNLKNPAVQALNAALGTDGGTPFGSPYISHNAPNEAFCSSSTVTRCNAYAMGAVAYLNYSPEPLDNFSFRPEIYYDPQGQRTATAATYWEVSIGWQHWFSPQIEIRPEIGYYRSNGANAFNGGTKNWTLIGAGDVIWHF
jgi:Putative beta-barrel porin-2, OmpL-like. bbp2